jgi:hypothetical protein
MMCNRLWTRRKHTGQVNPYDFPYITIFDRKKGFWLERQNPFTFYFLDWLRGSDLN